MAEDVQEAPQGVPIGESQPLINDNSSQMAPKPSFKKEVTQVDPPIVILGIFAFILAIVTGSATYWVTSSIGELQGYQPHSAQQIVLDWKQPYMTEIKVIFEPKAPSQQ